MFKKHKQHQKQQHHHHRWHGMALLGREWVNEWQTTKPNEHPQTGTHVPFDKRMKKKNKPTNAYTAMLCPLTCWHFVQTKRQSKEIFPTNVQSLTSSSATAPATIIQKNKMIVFFVCVHKIWLETMAMGVELLFFFSDNTSLWGVLSFRFSIRFVNFRKRYCTNFIDQRHIDLIIHHRSPKVLYACT